MPSIAVIGAGPIGLQAALALRPFGSVTIFESGGSIASNMKDWEHVKLFSPVSMNVSPQGLKAVKLMRLQKSTGNNNDIIECACDCDERVEADEKESLGLDMDAFLTGKEFVENYLNPIYEYLIKEKVQVNLNCTVAAISKCNVSSDSPLMKNRKKKERFRILLSYSDGKQSSAIFDYIIDATGTYAASQGKWLGSGSDDVIAMNSTMISDQPGFFNVIPDILGKDKEMFISSSGKVVDVIVVGSGYSAAYTLSRLRDLALTYPDEAKLHVYWVTRTPGTVIPYERIKDDPLPDRRALALFGNELASGNKSSLPKNMTVEFIHSTNVKAMSPKSVAGMRIKAIRNEEEMELDGDVLVANIGFKPELNLYGEVNMGTCWSTESPKKLPSPVPDKLKKSKDNGELLTQDMPGEDLNAVSPKSNESPKRSHSPLIEKLKTSTDSGEYLTDDIPDEDIVLQPSSHFFIIGMKSYGRSSDFLMRIGIEQIESISRIISKGR